MDVIEQPLRCLCVTLLWHCPLAGCMPCMCHQANIDALLQPKLMGLVNCLIRYAMISHDMLSSWEDDINEFVTQDDVVEVSGRAGGGRERGRNEQKERGGRDRGADACRHNAPSPPQQSTGTIRQPKSMSQDRYVNVVFSTDFCICLSAP